MIVIGNGWLNEGDPIDDDRIEYLHDHLEQMLDAILNDDVNIKGYAVFSIIDNFEWNEGFS